MNNKGAVETYLLAAIAIAAFGFFIKPDLFDRQTRNAKASVESTERLEDANRAQGAFAAASITSIAKANNEAPESPSRDFIALEAPVALSALPHPDYKALLDAEKRRAAVMEGRLVEIDRLYKKAGSDAEKLRIERDEALRLRQEADRRLVEAAAQARGAKIQSIVFGAVAILVLGLYFYLRHYSVNAGVLGRIAADMRGGIPAITALDVNIPTHLHGKVNRESRLASKLDE